MYPCIIADCNHLKVMVSESAFRGDPLHSESFLLLKQGSLESDLAYVNVMVVYYPMSHNALSKNLIMYLPTTLMGND